MSSKTFKNVKKPLRQPTAEEIAGFEATGGAARNTETRLSANTATRESRKTGRRVSVSPQTRKSVAAEIHEHANTEISEPAIPEAEPIARLTVDLPESAHQRFKAACAMSRRTMVQEIRAFIDRRTAELESSRN